MTVTRDLPTRCVIGNEVDTGNPPIRGPCKTASRSDYRSLLLETTAEPGGTKESRRCHNDEPRLFELQRYGGMLSDAMTEAAMRSFVALLFIPFAVACGGHIAPLVDDGGPAPAQVVDANLPASTEAASMPMPRTECATVETLCSGLCTSLLTDPSNCGVCGNACAPDDACTAGVCECPIGNTDCGFGCTDTMIDPDNCGMCGATCSAALVCKGGLCVPCGPERTQIACGSPQQCVNSSVDPENCGACGATCAAGANCVNGVCDCPAGQTVCTTCLGQACTDLTSDPDNCGACGNPCPDGATCTNGACACPKGDTACSGACVDELTDPNNCGTCGEVCPPGDACNVGLCTP